MEKGRRFTITVSGSIFLYTSSCTTKFTSPLDLYFSKTGILPASPYCVTVRAFDNSYIYQRPGTALTDAKACLYADMSNVSVHSQPIPARLIQGLPPPAATPSKKTIETINPREMYIKRQVQRIKYPSSDIYVHKTAQNFTRLTEPYNMVNLSNINIRFKIKSDPTESIGITKHGGIIFVRNHLKLYNSVANIFS